MSHVTVNLKRCPSCGEEKERTEFYRNASQKDGLSTYCKACIKVKSHESYLRNKDKQRERLKAWRAANPEKVKAQYVRQRQNNPDGEYEKQRRYRERHKEKLYEKGKRYRKEHPEYFARKCRERKAAKAETSDGTVTDAYLAELFDRQHHECVYCHCNLDISGKHLDHIVPLSRGGMHTASNVQWTCPSCNVSKGNRLEEEWPIERRPYAHKQLPEQEDDSETLELHATTQGSGTV